jgi:uncharacterized protein (DUF58 family)
VRLGTKTLERLAPLDVAARRATGGGRPGERMAGVAGVGTIFHEHRTYSPGDDLRYVDWNAYGRLRSLYVKVYEHEENLDVRLLVDATASMGSGHGSKLEAALRAAAMVGATALGRGDVVRLGLWPGEAARTFQGGAARRAFFDALAPASAREAMPLYDGVRSVTPPVRRRGFALLVSDFLDDSASWRRAVDYLCHLGLEVACVHVVSVAERSPQAKGALRLRDVETGAEVVLDVDDALLARYRARFDKRVREVRAYLASKRVRHVLLDTGHAGEAEVLRLLLREGVLR